MDYSTIHSFPDEKANPDALEWFLHDKVRCLSDILVAIERDVRRRKNLSLAVLYDLGRHYQYLKTKLFELYDWAIGRTRSIELRRLGLEKQLDALNQERRQEQVQAWRDIAELKKELLSLKR